MSAPSAAAKGGRGDEATGRAEKTGTLSTLLRMPAPVFAALAVLVLLSAAARLVGIAHGLPYSYYPDEAHFVKRAVAFGSGDLNPHWFHKPALLMYILFFQYGLYYLAGSAVGWFESVDAFAVSFFKDTGPFLLIGRLTVAAFGVASVAAVYALAARAAKSRAAGLAAALVLAFAIGHIATSQDVKEDVPCAFFVILALLSMVRFAERGGAADAAGAGVFMGLGMAVKYYPVFLVPALVLATFSAAANGGDPSKPAWRRDARAYGLFLLALVLFLLFFFAGSPFNFLDPTWYELNIRGRIDGLAKRIRLRPLTDPLDLAFGLRFKPRIVLTTSALAAIGLGLFLGFRRLARSRLASSPPARLLGRLAGAAAILFLFIVGPGLAYPRFFGQLESFFGTLVSWQGMGPLVGIPALAAAAIALFGPSPSGRILAAAFVAFVALSGVWTFEAIEARHLNVAYPILAALLAGGGARLLAGRVPAAAAAALAAVLVLPGAIVAIRENVIASRLDTRTEMAEYMEANLPQGARVLNDKGWVPLHCDTVRCQELLSEAKRSSGDGAFLVHRTRQYELMVQAAEESSRRTFYVIELDEPWWETRERAGGSYNATPHDHDMGNPNAVREPKTLAEYRRDGVRYVVTTSKTYRKALNADWCDRWPKFARFYAELGKLAPIHEIAESDGRPGPTVRLYDLSHLPAAEARPGD